MSKCTACSKVGEVQISLLAGEPACLLGGLEVSPGRHSFNLSGCWVRLFVLPSGVPDRRRNVVTLNVFVLLQDTQGQVIALLSVTEARLTVAARRNSAPPAVQLVPIVLDVCSTYHVQGSCRFVRLSCNAQEC
jgi:hypothetical protein